MRTCQFKYKATSYLANVFGLIFEMFFTLIGYVLFTPLFILLLIALVALGVLH